MIDEINLTKAASLQRVKSITSFSKSTIYRKIASDGFPRPIKISAKRVVWDEVEVKTWLNEQANKFAELKISNRIH